MSANDVSEALAAVVEVLATIVVDEAAGVGAFSIGAVIVAETA